MSKATSVQTGSNACCSFLDISQKENDTVALYVNTWVVNEAVVSRGVWMFVCIDCLY